ncbi:MAG: DUF89 family protein [Phycisphaerae bacterium]|nr:DUF89 family protein [Phycisphaerae bacterium]
MQTYFECAPCFVRQALDASRMVTDDPTVHERLIRETLLLVAEMPFDRSPPWMGQRIHRLLRELTGEKDPYRQVKQHSNNLALSLYAELKERVRGSADPFATAVRLAIAGNVIDFGCRSHLGDDEVHQAIEDAMVGSVDEVAMADLRQAVEGVGDILYLADNAGEIVFDRLLIEEMPQDRITLVVRGSPVINDATREDAEVAGLNSLVKVMDNGSDVPGTILESCSPSFQACFARSDLIIAKGQGNYETLSGGGRNIFFLLKVKCPVIAGHIGCDVGQVVVLRQNRRSERV